MKQRKKSVQEKHNCKKRRRKICIIILLCVIYMIFMTATFFGMGIYIGTDYEQELGSMSQIFYEKRYLKLEDNDMILIRNESGEPEIKYVKEVPKEVLESNQVIGKILLHW